MIKIKTDTCAAEGCTNKRKISPKNEKRTMRSSRFCSTHLSRWNRTKKLELDKKTPAPEGVVKHCAQHGPLMESQVYRVENYLRCKECQRQNMLKNYIKKHGRAPKVRKDKETRYTRKPNTFADIARLDVNKIRSDLDMDFKEINDVLIRYETESIDGY